MTWDKVLRKLFVLLFLFCGSLHTQFGVVKRPQGRFTTAFPTCAAKGGGAFPYGEPWEKRVSASPDVKCLHTQFDHMGYGCGSDASSKLPGER